MSPSTPERESPELTGDFAGPRDEESPPRRLGDYRLLREVGRGGMGVVYEAEQISLGRRVALKLLPAQMRLDPTFLERFRREAKAAAHLHHTNIVPVFGVGEHDGTPFYAMQFIAGEGLDKVLADLRRLRGTGQVESGGAASALLGGFSPPTATVVADSSPLAAGPPRSATSPTLSVSGTDGELFRGVARLGLQVAEALAYAHRQGVLHRDIKPSNLLLDAYGTVWVTDFGLAKAEGGDDLTRTGDIVGTVRFMAPERFDGRSLPQGDVYALGLTLYELVTLQPAFSDANKARLIEKVLHEPPTPPRRHEPRVPRDLETIVLKCLAKDPRGRYARADDLADDLCRFLADRPIRARRAGSVEHAWRWCRRNPALASMTAALFAVLTIAAVAGLLLSWRLSNALDKTRQAEAEARRKLILSYVSEADATRMSNRPGQRFAALEKLREALAVTDEVGLGDAERRRLRNVAIAALCLPDLGPGPLVSEGGIPLDGIDPVFRRDLTAFPRSRLPEPTFELHGGYAHSPDGRFLIAASAIQGAFAAAPVKLWRVDETPPRVVCTDSDGSYEEAKGFSPDSRLVAIGHADGSATVYDTATGRRLRRLGTGPGAAFTLAFHPTLPRLAVAAGSDVLVWDVEDGRLISRLPHTSYVSSLTWHPRGHRLATAAANIQLWNAEAGRPITGPWRNSQGEGIRVAFSRRGDRLASNDYSGVLRLWDTATGEMLVSRVGNTGLTFASDDRSLGIYGSAGGVAALRVAGGQELRKLTRPTPHGPEKFLGVTLHPGGRLLAATTESGLALLDVATGEEIAFAEGRFSQYLAFDETGAMWTKGAAGLTRWPLRVDPASPSRLRFGPPEWVEEALEGFSVSADGRSVVLAVGARTNGGALVVHRSGPTRTVRLGPQYDVRSASISADGRWAVCKSHWYMGTNLSVWDAREGRVVARFSADMVSGFAGFSADSRWGYFSGKEVFRLELARLAESRTPVEGMTEWQAAWASQRVRVDGVPSPDGRLRATGGEDGTISLVTPDMKEVVARLPTPEIGRVGPIAFTPGGGSLLVLGDESKSIFVFDLRRVRARLAEMGLDWDDPPPAADWADGSTLRVKIEGAHYAAGREAMTECEIARAALALHLNPLDAESHARLGRMLWRAGRNDPARAHLGTALALGGDERSRLYRASADSRLRLWGDAVEDASRILARCPYDYNARVLRAGALRQLKRYPEAITDYTEALGATYEAESLHELRALCYQATGRGDLAAADREQAKRLGATSPAALNSKAWRLVTGPVGTRDPARAIELVRDALKQRPGHVEYLNTLGVAQYRAGLFEEAAATLEQSLAAGDGQYDGFDLFFLALCRHKLGDAGRAKNCLDRAIRWSDSRKGLSPMQLDQLREFRAEAERALRGE